MSLKDDFAYYGEQIEDEVKAMTKNDQDFYNNFYPTWLRGMVQAAQQQRLETKLKQNHLRIVKA